METILAVNTPIITDVIVVSFPVLQYSVRESDSESLSVCLEVSAATLFSNERNASLRIISIGGSASGKYVK